MQGRLLLGTSWNHPEPSLNGHILCKYMKSILKKSRNSVKYSKLKLLLQDTDPNNIHEILQERPLLGTPRNHPEPTLPGRNRCKYENSILEKGKILSNTQN